VSLVGDSASGVSSELDWQEWSFVNVDLDVHILRPVHGPWVLLDARTQLGGHGSALTRATIFDVAGELGATAQTLVLAPRRR
jgi:acyl-CoA thioesterase